MTVILNVKNRNREKIWKVIRGLMRFTFNEVMTLSGVSYHTVSSYLLLLYQAGYIRQDGKTEEADGRRKAAWRLIKNTGPKAPVSCRCLYDPNIEDVAALRQNQDDKKEPSNVD